MAVTALFMGAAAFRYLRVNLQGGGWVTTGALAVLLTQMPWSSQWLPSEVAGRAKCGQRTGDGRPARPPAGGRSGGDGSRVAHHVGEN